MKKIALVLPPWLPVPAVKGGAIETLVTLLASENEKYGEVIFHIFSVYDYEAERESCFKKSKIFYINVHKENFFSKTVIFIAKVIRKFFLHDLIISDYYKKVFNICKKNNYDFIVAEGGLYYEFKKFAHTFGKEKLVLHIHCNLLWRKSLAGIFGSTISVSNYVNDAWKGSCCGKITENEQKNFVVINAVDEDLFIKRISAQEKMQIRKSFGLTDSDIMLLYIGRILEVKGVLELIQATLEINNSNVKLLIIGSVNFGKDDTSDYMLEVSNLVKKNPERIKQLGYIDNKDVYKYAKAADIRVLPSKWEEAGSLALIESIHANVPIIITRSGGMPEVVNEDGVIIIEKDENIVNNLKSSIIYLINNPKKLESMKIANMKQSKKICKKNFYYDFINVFKFIK